MGDFGGCHDCPCRDCFEIAIGGLKDAEGDYDDDKPGLCNDCEEAGCSAEGEHGCSVECDIYDDENVEITPDGNVRLGNETCPCCRGEGCHIGALGDNEVFRCRNCGWTFNEGDGDAEQN